jgi:hypothetical protein
MPRIWSFARATILLSLLMLTYGLPTESASSVDDGASWQTTSTPGSYSYDSSRAEASSEHDEPLTGPDAGSDGKGTTPDDGMIALSKALEAAGAAEVPAGSLRFSDLINNLLSRGGNNGDDGREGESTTTPPSTPFYTTEPVDVVTPVPTSTPAFPSGPVDEGVPQSRRSETATVKQDDSGASWGKVSVQADGEGSRNCRSSCGKVFQEHSLCSSGWEGQSALCGRGFRGVPGLEPREDHCLRCAVHICKNNTWTTSALPKHTPQREITQPDNLALLFSSLSHYPPSYPRDLKICLDADRKETPPKFTVL